MFTIIPLGIIIISLGAMLFIVARHIPKVAGLDVSTMPEERESHLKSTMLEKRFFRKFEAVRVLVVKSIAPITKRIAQWQERNLKKLRSIERSYRFSASAQLPDSEKKSDARVQEQIDRAEEALSKKEYDTAERAYVSALKIQPANPALYHGLGGVYRLQEEWDQARETYEYITKNWPQDVGGFGGLAAVAEATGRLEEAKDHYLHALSIDNEVVEYHMNLAQLYRSTDDSEKALSSLQRAQYIQPNNPRILDQLLEVSILVGRKDLAQETLLKIKKVNADHGGIKKLEKKVAAMP